ncbi:YacC family pilotin-like protein [Vagococcus sp. WN89Y]|uniref:YacC family pilotin-like protein n=1 Tax=Vagococcus sp. WN89Y TaxID=3457258 RepID=UPI003FCC6AB3
MGISLFVAGSFQLKPFPCRKVKQTRNNKYRRPFTSVLTFKFRHPVVERMKTFFKTVILGSLLAVSVNSYALSESEAEDMADLTAVFVFLKNDCGYNDLPNGQIRRALVFFAQQNQWDLSNYDSWDMKSLGEESYRDLSGIGIPTAKKCKALARDSLSLLAYVK